MSTKDEVLAILEQKNTTNISGQKIAEVLGVSRTAVWKAINTLKEAGFTLAFAGGFNKATLNVDRYQIPRYVMYDYTTVNELAGYIN